MLFTTLDFFIFLPVAVVLFHVLPARMRLPWLMLASLGYYASFGIENLGYLGAVAVIALLAGRHLLDAGAARRRLAFWAGTLGILALMGLLKYYDAIVEGIAWLPGIGLTAPAGFSFYAFTAIALLADRYRSPAETRATAGQDIVYLAWFPKILAGPIERVAPFTAALGRRSTLTPVMVVAGSQLILWGLFKKVVVADNLSPFVDRAYAIPAYAVPVELIIATYFFAFQIYCDFSGYTDIARGSSRLFGIKLSENFRRAYFAQSVGEFWSRRWHISLASWFRDYLYYPIVGGREHALWMYLGVLVVFIASGIWHAGLGYGIGWGFVAWGLLNGLYLVFERALSPLRKRLKARLRGTILGRIVGVGAALLVFHLVLISWVFFRAGTIGDSLTILRRIWAALPDLPRLLMNYPFTTEHKFLAGLIVVLLVIELAQEMPALSQRVAALPRAVHWAGWYALLFAVIGLGAWQAEVFVYMQF